MTDQSPTRCGFVALIGEPNAGKSTLMNRMVGAKVSIVTHKVQTTRTVVRGIALEGASQIVFLDTPGLFRPRRRLDRAMVASAWAGVGSSDRIALMIEAHRGLTGGVRAIIGTLEEHAGSTPVDLIVNKVDMIRREKLLALVAEASELFKFAEVFLISAETGSGIEDLRKHLAAEMPEGPWHYPEDQIADLPMRMIAAEITREKLTLRLHQELPYQLTVETETWTEQKDGSVRIEQIVYVMRDGHKGIVLGRRGETIKDISIQARQDIATLIERPVHLFLTVKSRPNWQNEPERYRNIGLDYADES